MLNLFTRFFLLLTLATTLSCGRRHSQITSSPSTLASYAITLDGNGATTGANTNTTVTSGASFTVPGAGALEKSDTNEYGFLRWNTAADGSGTDYQVGDIFTPTADTTLYAIWGKVLYVEAAVMTTTPDGSRTSPFNDLESAINAAGNSAEIRIANGAYSLSGAIFMNSGMHLRGGYDPTTWTQDAATSTTVFTTTSSFNCFSDSKPFLIEGLNIESNTGSGFDMISLRQCPNGTFRYNTLKQVASNGYGSGIIISGTEINHRIYNNKIEIAAARATWGIAFTSQWDTGTVRIYNNLILDQQEYSVNQPSGPIGFYNLNSGNPGTSKTLIVANNTLGVNRPSQASFALGQTSTSSDFGTIQLYFDNNIVFGLNTPTALENQSGLHFKAGINWDIKSLKNNNFFNFNKIYWSEAAATSAENIGDLESAFASSIASGNLSTEMLSAGYFTDSSNNDYTLSSSAPAAIRTGGLNLSSAYGFSILTDLTGKARTSGWSRGCFEKD